MTKEEKDLLLKDLCGRLPYDLIIQYHDKYDWSPIKLREICKYTLNDTYSIEKCKPYLRPMTSMTNEEKMFLNEIVHSEVSLFVSGVPIWSVYETEIEKYIDFCNSHYLDWRGLIEKGLALEAKNDMYNF